MSISVGLNSDNGLPVPRHVLVLVSIAGLVLMLCFWAGTTGRILQGHNDFLGLYAGGRLCGTPGLYNAEAVARIELSEGGATGPALRFTRAPFYALMLHPLALLPYRTAYLVWICLNIGAIVAFICFWAEADRRVLIAACCSSVPIAASFANGQDIPFLLLFIAVAMRLFRGRRFFLVGLVLSLCAIKYHLFILIPFVLFARRLWTVILGASVGALALFGLSFFAGGSSWLADYWRVLNDPAVHPAVAAMPNLNGMTSAFPYGQLLLIALSLVIAAACWIIGRRLTFQISFATALLGSTLLSYHSYLADVALLIPAFLVLVEQRVLQRNLAFFLLTPVPWFLLLRGGWAADLTRAALMLELAACAWVAWQRAPQMLPSPQTEHCGCRPVSSRGFRDQQRGGPGAVA